MRLGDTEGAKRRHEGGGSGRLGDSCGLCGDAILDVNEIVRPSAYPWNLPDVPGDLAHRDCTNSAMAQADAGRRDADDAYREAMGWPDGSA